MNMPELESERLRIRPFRKDDLETIHRILDDGFGQDERINATDSDATALTERRLLVALADCQLRVAG